MERQNYKLTIDNPCNQDWTSMTQNDLGKYCTHCSKTIVDFSTLSNNEIVQFIGQSSGKLCGRLTKQQLNRYLESDHCSNIASLSKVLAGLLLVGTVENSVNAGIPSREMGNISITSNESITRQEFNKNGNPIADSLKNLVQGKIIDSITNESLPVVTILIKGTKTGVTTDLDGKFRLILPDSLITEQIILEVKYTAYESKEISFESKDLPLNKEIFIIPSEHFIVGGICIVKKKRWWQFWK